MKGYILTLAILAALVGTTLAAQRPLQPSSLLQVSDQDGGVGNVDPIVDDGAPDSVPDDANYNHQHVTPEITDELPPQCKEEGCGPPQKVEEHIVPEFKEDAVDSSCVPNCVKGPEDFIEPEMREPEPAVTEDGKDVVRIVDSEEIVDGEQGIISSEDPADALDQFEEGTGDLGTFEDEADPMDDADDVDENATNDLVEDVDASSGGDSECPDCDDKVTTTTTTVTTVTTGPAGEVEEVHPEKVAAAVANVVHKISGDSSTEEGNEEAGEDAEAAEDTSFAEKMTKLRRKRSKKRSL